MHSPQERTPRNVELPARELPRASFEQFALGRVVAAWAARGSSLPVAVVVSIFEDVCEALESGASWSDAPSWSHPVALDQVVIDDRGVARLSVVPADAVGALSSLLYATLSARGDDEVPALARPLILQGLSDDPWVRPPSHEVMRVMLRSLAPPAARDEVLNCCTIAFEPDLPLEVPSVVEACASVSSFLPGVIIEEPETEVVQPADLAAAALVAPAEPDPRPVVRHEPIKRTPVSLPTAPAARVRSLQNEEVSETIELPSEGRGHVASIVALLIFAALLVAYLLGFLPF